MIVKKFKKGRGDKEGVVQVKLRSLNGDRGVVLEVVDADGERVAQGTVLVVDASGVAVVGSFGCGIGFKMDANNDKINVR